MTMKEVNPDIIDLLVKRATESLDHQQQEELQALLKEHDLEDTPEFDLAAAAAANAFGVKSARDYVEAPDGLKAKLKEDADKFFGGQDGNVVELGARQPRRAGWNWGWATAAALAIALVATNIADFRSATDYDAARQQLMAEAEGTLVIPWATPDDPEYAQVTGDVVWNDARQEGYLLLTGMPVNDPTESQYQLWVVDPDRDSNPVDGGIFDIPPGESTVVVPIDAKLAVDNPAVFAITREKPGGVVVSDGPLLVVASAG